MQNELRKSFDSEDEAIITQIVPSPIGCPLCPQIELPESIAPEQEKLEETFQIGSEDKNQVWLCRSVVDPYPITHPSMFKLKSSTESTETYSAHGWSEVIVETRDHNKELHELSSEEIKNVLLVYMNRIPAFRKKDNVAHVCILKDNLRNEFNHSYSKLVTLPIVPEKAKEKTQRFNDFQFKHSECLYCNIIEKEKNSQRSILENDQFIVLAPYVQNNPHEVLILPKKHHTCISEMNQFEAFTLAETIKNVLTRLSVVLNPFKYSMVFHLRPNQEKDFHFHIAMGQKTLHPTLQEGYGLKLSRTTPEETAKLLRG
jgi:UDPglucose--hexose-1-phosphate uridylyltransferase